MKNRKIIFTQLLFTLGFIALISIAEAVSPPPAGGYPNFNTAEGQNALFNLTTGQWNTSLGAFTLWSNTDGSFNTAVGTAALLLNVGNQGSFQGIENTAVGASALLSNTTGSNNTATGVQSLFSNTSGNFNTATGVAALFHNTDGIGNTAVGNFALANLTSGANNIALGNDAGSGNVMGDNNIYIGNGGSFESTTIRIGIQGVQTNTFIAGISTTAIVSGAPVAIDVNGQLGVTLSSRQFKKDIKPMDRTSETILALKPVTFHYQNDTTITPQFGLIAEEVAEIEPNLVVRDKQGKPYSVRYDQVNAMLLNEFLKEHRKVEKLEATVAEQQKGMQILAAHIKEQDSKIQRVITQIRLGEPKIAVSAR